MKSTPAWSYSSLKTFQSCPKKYYHLRVAKDVIEPQGEAALYGTRAHKAAEEYLRDGKDLEPEFEFMRKHLDTLAKIPGTHMYEFKLALNKELRPREFFAQDVWFRGVVDLLIISEDRTSARIIDYKFGKSKNADTSQLQLMALAVFKNFPTVERAKAGLLFCAEDKLIPTKYDQEDAPIMWSEWISETKRLEAAYESGVWNASPSGLCRGWCPVEKCAHWQPRR